jgi:hypothetical protein
MWQGMGKMKALVVLSLVILGAATAVAYSPAGVMTAVAAHTTSSTSEPAALLLSGGVLIGLAGALRRFTL